MCVKNLSLDGEELQNA